MPTAKRLFVFLQFDINYLPASKTLFRKNDFIKVFEKKILFSTFYSTLIVFAGKGFLHWKQNGFSTKQSLPFCLPESTRIFNNKNSEKGP